MFRINSINPSDAGVRISVFLCFKCGGFVIMKYHSHCPGKDEDGEEKLAKLFFTLAACNPDEHLNNIQQLASLFCNEELLDALMAANTPEDILAAEAAHPIEEM